MNQIPSDSATEKLTAYIREKSLNPGDKLPNEYELSKLLEVSRSTLREAIKALSGRNILEVRRGVGTFVADVPGFVNDPWGVDFFQSEIETARQLLDIRLFIEPELAALAAKNATFEELEEIMRSCICTENEIFAGKQHYNVDAAFHIAIAKASHNAIAFSIMRQVFFHSIPKQTKLSNNSLLKETISTHSRIAENIAAGKAELAREAMYKHLEFNKEYIADLLENEKSGD